jgi:RimJ/RimL family protein N-acetyltransferase
MNRALNLNVVAGVPRQVELRNGTRVRLRAIRPDDESRLVQLYDDLSQDSRYQRFFTVMRRLPPDWAHYLANVDYVRRLALVVEAPGDPQALIAVARYEATTDAHCAEVAFVVQDAWQNRGLGTVLFRALLEAASNNGVKRFCAWVLGDNQRMLDLICRLGEVRQRALEQGVVELRFTARSVRRCVSS